MPPERQSSQTERQRDLLTPEFTVSASPCRKTLNSRVRFFLITEIASNPETVDERLRPQTLGPEPKDLIRPVPGNKTMEYDDLLVVAAATANKYTSKNYGNKRQQTLAELAASNVLQEKKSRSDTGGTRAAESTEPGYATDVITPEAAATKGGCFP